MGKKLTLLAMAITALVAFVIPTAASASVMTMNEEPVEVGTEINGTSSNAVTENLPEAVGGGNLVCSKVTITGEVTKNSEGVVKGVGKEGVNNAEGCETTLGVPVEIEEPKLVEMESAETGTGTVHLTFIANINHGAVLCHYTGTGVFHYEVGSDVIHITPTALSSTAELCEEEGLSFSATFTLETSGGGAVLLE